MMLLRAFLSIALLLAPLEAFARNSAANVVALTPRVAPPLMPTGTRVCMIGDSRTFYNNGFQSPAFTWFQSRGDLIQAVSADPRVRFEAWTSVSDPDDSTLNLTTTAATTAGTVLTFASTTGTTTTGTIGVTASTSAYVSGPSIPTPVKVASVTATTITLASAVTVPAGEREMVAFTRGFWGSNDGVAGQATYQMQARIKQLVAMRCEIVIINGGINDGGIVANSIASLTQMVRPLLAANRRVILTTVEPIAALEYPTKALQTPLNQAIRSFATSTPGVSLCDLSTSLVADGSYAPPQYFEDGLHLSPVATAPLQGPTLSACIAAIVAPGNWLVNRYWSNGTNLLTNPTFTGTSGTDGANATGSVPTSWRVWAGVSGTFYSTQAVTLANNSAETGTGGQTVAIQITPGGTAASETTAISPTTATVAASPNTWYIGWAEVDLDAGQQYVGAYVKLIDNNTTVDSAYGSLYYDTTYNVMPPLARRVWLQTPLLRTGASATTLAFSLVFTMSTQPAVTQTSTGTQPAANQALLTSGTGVVLGQVATTSCSGGTIPGGTTVIGAPLNWNYVTFSANVTIPTGCAITFSPPGGTSTPTVRRVWLGLADPPSTTWGTSVQ